MNREHVDEPSLEVGGAIQEPWVCSSEPTAGCDWGSLPVPVSVSAPVAQLLGSVQLRDRMGCSPPGSSVPGILQARTLQGLPFPPSDDLPDPGTEPMSPVSPALAGRCFPPAPPCAEAETGLAWKLFILRSRRGVRGKEQGSREGGKPRHLHH